MFHPFLNIKHYSFLILISAFFFSTTFAQKDEDVIVARVGDKIITKSEFESRLNFSPRKDVQDRNSSIGIKREMLYTLIAEKLWSIYAENIGYENNRNVIAALNSTRKMFVRDELYRVEIREKINISDSLVNVAMERSNKLLELTVVYSPDHSKLINVKKQLESSPNIEDNFLSIESEGVKTKNIKISFGDLDESLEDIIYSLEINQITDVIEMNDIWNLFILKNVEENSESSVEEIQKKIDEIAKKLSERSENKSYNVFYDQFFKDKKVDADGKLLKIIANNLSEIFIRKETNGIYSIDNKNEKVFVFDTKDLEEILISLGKEVYNKNFLFFEQDPINVETFLREFSFLSFRTNSTKYSVIVKKLNQRIKEYIKHELLAREGLHRGLDQSQNVQKWVKTWYENYLYQAIKSDFLKNKLINDESNILNKVDIPDRFKAFINKTIELSDSYNVYVYENEFDQVKMGNINLFVLRKLGFGGSIAAVPSSPPFIEWYTQKQKQYKHNL